MSEPHDVLIVEDELIVQQAAERILRLEDLTVHKAAEADEAARKLHDHTYCLILSDLMLPGSSGFDIIELARSRSPTTQVIVITGYATLDNAIRSFALGAFDVIPKPFDVSELLGVVFRALRFRELSATPGGVSTPPSPDSEKRYFLGQHSWALLEPGGAVLFGVAETFPHTLGHPRMVELPEPDGHTLQGRSFLKMSSEEEVYQVWAPLTGQIIAVNPRIADETDLIDTDPYGHGWLVRIVPSNLEEELQSLTRRQPSGSPRFPAVAAT